MITEPLTRFLQKDVAWTWLEEQDAAFPYLPRRIHRVIHAEASSAGIDAVLLQRDENGRMVAVAYYS